MGACLCVGKGPTLSPSVKEESLALRLSQAVCVCHIVAEFGMRGYSPYAWVDTTAVVAATSECETDSQRARSPEPAHDDRNRIVLCKHFGPARGGRRCDDLEILNISPY
ncbi:hypothetical protein JYU34_016703 [Plutella xylostella]|uniref:Uncharacterized protein n=1 Tax=Plutella xylostella TaxID=51655 RepID=A0ABQ7Q3K0_PLUXY|nr:hypothetical protein JYU34_016703 [Plutella xylostella]